MSRTELWEAPKGAPVEGHFAFTVDDDEHVRLPYTLLVTLMQSAGLGLRRKITTHHEPRWSIHPVSAPVQTHAPSALTGDGSLPPPGYRWLSPRECHGNDAFCSSCSPRSPQRRVAPADA